MDFQINILNACDEFKGEWSDTVRGRVLFVPDIPAADAVYHIFCSGNFRTGKQIPKICQPYKELRAPKCKKISGSGRPKDIGKSQAFEAVAEFLEDNDDEQVTINCLINKILNILKTQI